MKRDNTPTIPVVDLSVHHQPGDMSDRFALSVTKLLRWCADTFFAKRYGHRAIVLETVAAVPGMVGATLTHLRCLRKLEADRGWIRTLMEEAENERMHLMTFVAVAQPTLFERWLILLVQWLFYIGFFVLYLFSARTAHRLVGYFEEEAVISYTHYLNEIDAGRSANVPAPAIALQYWGLPANATLRDVVLVVRADEAHHRDVNHGFAAQLGDHAGNSGPSPDLSPDLAPYPWHASTLEIEKPAITPYRKTADFNETTLPAALKRRHNTASGVWGVVRVKQGQLKLTFLEPHSEQVLDASNPGYLAPQQDHFVEPLGKVSVCVEFYHSDPRPA
jgi:ubiquinol oxidase